MYMTKSVICEHCKINFIYADALKRPSLKNYEFEIRCPKCLYWGTHIKCDILPKNIEIVTITKECECGIKDTHTELRYKKQDEDLIITKQIPLEKLIFRSEFLDKVFETNKNLFGQYVQELEKKVFIK